MGFQVPYLIGQRWFDHKQADLSLVIQNVFLGMRNLDWENHITVWNWGLHLSQGDWMTEGWLWAEEDSSMKWDTKVTPENLPWFLEVFQFPVMVFPETELQPYIWFLWENHFIFRVDLAVFKLALHVLGTCHQKKKSSKFSFLFILG